MVIDGCRVSRIVRSFSDCGLDIEWSIAYYIEHNIVITSLVLPALLSNQFRSRLRHQTERHSRNGVPFVDIMDTL